MFHCSRATEISNRRMDVEFDSRSQLPSLHLIGDDVQVLLTDGIPLSRVVGPVPSLSSIRLRVHV